MYRTCASILTVALVAALPTASAAQTTDELNRDGRNTDNVTTQSMGLDRKNYSPLARSTGRTSGVSFPCGTRA